MIKVKSYEYNGFGELEFVSEHRCETDEKAKLIANGQAGMGYIVTIK